MDDLLETDRDGLREAFEVGADTMSAVSDIVTPYDLAYQAKAALCNYVPQLHTTYDADDDDVTHIGSDIGESALITTSRTVHRPARSCVTVRVRSISEEMW